MFSVLAVFAKLLPPRPPLPMMARFSLALGDLALTIAGNPIAVAARPVDWMNRRRDCRLVGSEFIAPQRLPNLQKLASAKSKLYRWSCFETEKRTISIRFRLSKPGSM